MGRMKSIYTALSFARDKEMMKHVFKRAIEEVEHKWEDRSDNFVRLPIYGNLDNAEALMWALMEYYQYSEKVEEIHYQYAGANQTLLYGVEVVLNFTPAPPKKPRTVPKPTKISVPKKVKTVLIKPKKTRFTIPKIRK